MHNRIYVVFITQYPPTCSGRVCGQLQGGTNNNTTTITEVSEPLHH